MSATYSLGFYSFISALVSSTTIFVSNFFSSIFTSGSLGGTMSNYFVTSIHGGTVDCLCSNRSRSISVTSTGVSSPAFISSFLSLLGVWVSYYFLGSAFGFSFFLSDSSSSLFVFDFTWVFSWAMTPPYWCTIVGVYFKATLFLGTDSILLIFCTGFGA